MRGRPPRLRSRIFGSKMRRSIYGPRSERKARCSVVWSCSSELEATFAEDDPPRSMSGTVSCGCAVLGTAGAIAAQKAAAQTTDRKRALEDCDEPRHAASGSYQLLQLRQAVFQSRQFGGSWQEQAQALDKGLALRVVLGVSKPRMAVSRKPWASPR